MVWASFWFFWPSNVAIANVVQFYQFGLHFQGQACSCYAFAINKLFSDGGRPPAALPQRAHSPRRGVAFVRLIDLFWMRSSFDFRRFRDGNKDIRPMFICECSAAFVTVTYRLRDRLYNVAPSGNHLSLWSTHHCRCIAAYSGHHSKSR